MTTLKRIVFSTSIFLGIVNNVSGQDSSLADTYFLQAANFKKNTAADSALIYYEKAAVEFEKLGDVEKFIDSYNQIGIILTKQDKYEEAKSYLNKALSKGLMLPDPNHLAIATSYISLGVVYSAEKNYEQSLIYHNKALAMRLLKLGEYHGEVATSYGNIGNVHRFNMDLDRSVDAHLKAMKIREKVFGPASAEIIESYVGLGNAYREKKDYNTSLKYFEKALNNKIVQRGEGHKDLVKFYKYNSDVYYLMNDKLKGDEYKMKWEQIEKN